MKVNNITRMIALCLMSCFLMALTPEQEQLNKAQAEQDVLNEKARLEAVQNIESSNSNGQESPELEFDAWQNSDRSRDAEETSSPNPVKAPEQTYIEWKQDQQAAAKQGGQPLQALSLPVAPMMSNDSREWIGGVLTVTTDSWGNESAWTLLVDWYGDGNLYYVCFEADEYGSCINSGWQDGYDDNATSTMTIGMDTDKQYQLVVYDQYADGGATVSAASEGGVVWNTTSASSDYYNSYVYGDMFSPVADAPNCTDITFTLSDQYNDGFEAYLYFGSDALTGNTGSTFTYCLEDGTYAYAYSCYNYCGEHS